MKVLEGKLSAKGMKVAIVASRFNEFITSKLIGGAEDCLLRHGADSDDLTLAWVPGAFEIPLAAQKLAKSGKYDAVVCVGAVIRGATPHFDYLTTDNIEQAVERAGTKAGNKGADAAMCAIEMVNLMREM